ncbi:SigE family RNA polymerase sigma factor [Saccharothrix longispora]|uniref:SigE family RNA polymerase sigma factor n=1 Tax=Saccharothrix longispora TaxID=33920 RepID=UPI0028FD1367|nr:SigE family RNA polymerase sigma factor [Saccharothrix longispora]MBY8847362.1 SigE family RNA polymerase sigma factor [Saccharothrix sp. MB29]MDU0290826.1 SigE family RNA polymerase sigma factor [Saccharothrix longispora]
MHDRDREFRAYFEARAVVVRRTAFLMCGDWHRAEDLAQTALAKVYAHWGRLERDGKVDAYVRKVLVRSFIDDVRWRGRRPETVVRDVPEVAGEAPGVEDAVDVRRALEGLPPRQRAAVVLRYWEDLPVAETAAAMGCSEGTVKSQVSKGPATLRRSPAAGRTVLWEGS